MPEERIKELVAKLDLNAAKKTRLEDLLAQEQIKLGIPTPQVIIEPPLVPKVFNIWKPLAITGWIGLILDLLVRSLG